MPQPKPTRSCPGIRPLRILPVVTVQSYPTTGDSSTANIYDLSPAALGTDYLYQDSLQYTSASNSNGAGYFLDNYYFTVTASQLYSITDSISTGTSGISNLAVRLISWNPNQSGIPFPSGSPTAQGGTGSVVVSWDTATASGNFDVATISAGLQSGVDYVLQVQGNVAVGGGNYTGSLDLTPTPLPANLPLLGAGLGLMALWGRRRRA